MLGKMLPIIKFALFDSSHNHTDMLLLNFYHNCYTLKSLKCKFFCAHHQWNITTSNKYYCLYSKKKKNTITPYTTDLQMVFKKFKDNFYKGQYSNIQNTQIYFISRPIPHMARLTIR